MIADDKFLFKVLAEVIIDSGEPSADGDIIADVETFCGVSGPVELDAGW